MAGEPWTVGQVMTGHDRQAREAAAWAAWQPPPHPFGFGGEQALAGFARCSSCGRGILAPWHRADPPVVDLPEPEDDDAPPPPEDTR